MFLIVKTACEKEELVGILFILILFRSGGPSLKINKIFKDLAPEFEVPNYLQETFVSNL